MPPTLVNVAVGVLVGVALLGAAFDRRSIAVVALAAAVPDLDALFALAEVGAPNATFHSIFIPLGAGAILYFDTEVRETSRLGERCGWYGIRVAWVALAAYAVAGIGLDAFSVESVAFLYPFSNRYYAVVGKFVLSTQDGVVQTYVAVGERWLLASPGTTETHVVESWIASNGGERRIRLVESGHQAALVVIAIAAVPAKYLIERGDRRGGSR